jgi:hypothetical protein
MAQTKSKTSSSTAKPKSSTRANGSRASGSGNRSTAKKRTSSNGNRAKATRTARPRSQARLAAEGQTGTESVKDTAKTAGHAVGQMASKARTPLIAGGMALAGAAAGAVIRSKVTASRSRNPLARVRGMSVPTPKIDLNKLDLDRFKSAAERVSAYGQQASDIAAAIEKTRKKNS